MKEPVVDMSTDAAWEEWGTRDPYYGVITNPKFRRAALSEDAKREFFESGASHVHHVLTTIRKHIDPEFAPRRILEFGCGVGRVLVPFAGVAEDVLGVDVSEAMLQEAQKNCDDRQLHNVRLLQSDDHLSQVKETFDLLHSAIVFQHIPIERGRTIFTNLLRRISPGGVAAIQLTYSKTRFSATHGVAPPAPPEIEVTRAAPSRSAHAIAADVDPEIQMNPYNMNEILFIMQHQGVQQYYAEFTDHGGELGAFLFFSMRGPVLAP